MSGGGWEEAELELPEPVAAVVAAPRLVAPAGQDSPVQRALDQHRGAALLGLEYLVEVREQEHGQWPVARCLLCHKEVALANLVGHVTSASHRLAYLEAFFPIVRRKFLRVANLKFWQNETFEFLGTVVSRIETKCGRLGAWVVEGRGPVTRELAQVEAAVEAGVHFRETAGLNFRTIPCPFASYLGEVPEDEVVDTEAMEEPRARPGVEVAREERIVRRSSSRGGGVVDSQEGSSSMLGPKGELMNRIASLRKEIKKDDKCVKVALKERHELEERVVRRKSTEVEMPAVEAELVEVSDEELPQEKDLKLRKPSKRGLRSRNPDGLGSRKEREREEERRGKGRGDEERGRDRGEEERGAMEKVRGAHMDGERNLPRGRREEREQVEGRAGSEVASKEKFVRPDMEEGARGRGRDVVVEDTRVGRGKERKEEGRKRDRWDEGRSREGDRKEEGGSREGDKKEVRSRDGGKKEEGRSRERRRSRSKEQRRSRSRDRRRERSVSPHVAAMERWKKFKQAEKVMLDQVSPA